MIGEGSLLVQHTPDWLAVEEERTPTSDHSFRDRYSEETWWGASPLPFALLRLSIRSERTALPALVARSQFLG